MHRMKMTAVSLALAAVQATSASAYELVSRNDLQQWASGFSCSNPKLQWQFEHLLSIYDENAKMPGGRKVVDRAADVGGDGDWLYRGVTNSQFNESQILSLIFNDSTQVSESRWLTNSMFDNAALGANRSNLVGMRTQFHKIPLATRWGYFQKAFEKVSGEIRKLSDSKTSGNMSDFSEHIRIGASFNGTPQAIQFLSPHKDYAEAYGEYVLHIHETVKRGVDVERYNANNRAWSYSLGSIYSRDRDEYEVPSHIPGWDIQAVKVRNGSAWLGGNYGPPIYYYTKVTPPKNPCDVIGIRVDKAAGDGVDEHRVPVGMLLKCANADGSGCVSSWDHAVSEEPRMKAAVEATRVDDHPIYYVPYALFVGGDRNYLKSAGLGSVVSMYPNLKKDIVGDADFWSEILLKDAAKDWASAAKLLELNKSLLPIYPKLKADVEAKMAAGIKPEASDVAGLIRYLSILGAAPTKSLTDAILAFSGRPVDRAGVWSTLQKSRSERKDAWIAKLDQDFLAKMSAEKNLSPVEEIQLELTKAGSVVSVALAQKVAIALAKDPTFAAQVPTVLVGTHEFRVEILEKAFDYLDHNHDTLPLADPYAAWDGFAPMFAANPGRDRILGRCIDYAIASGKYHAYELSVKTGQAGLPEEREVDTIRAIWSYSKTEPTVMAGAPNPTNAFRFFSEGMNFQLFMPSVRNATTLDAADSGKRTAGVQTAYAEFLLEQVNPPQPLIGFSALNMLRKLQGTTSELLLWPTEDVKFDLYGKSYTIPKMNFNTLLGESISTYYLNYLKTAYAAEQDAKKKKRISDTFKNVVAAYTTYILNGLEADLGQPFYRQLFEERMKWNKFENTAALAYLLADLNPAKATELRAAAKKIVKAIPAMSEKSEIGADQAAYEALRDGK